VGGWLKEYLRVETDKFLLFVLIVYFFHYDPHGDLIKIVLGALVMATQNNRYSAHPPASVPPGEGAANGASKV